MTFTKKFIIFTISFLLLFGGVVVFFDPFYHFHKPVGNMKAVLNQPEYQVVGTIENFDYDSVIVGTSMAENFDNTWFDNSFNCKTIKLIKTGGTTPEHAYYLEKAFEKRNLKNVFYSLDVAAICNTPENDFPDDSMPLYLYDNNPFNDIQYVFNKDVLFKHIPYMIAQNKNPEYNEGESYSFAKDKSFSAADAINNYVRSDILASLDFSEYEASISSNIEILKGFIEENSDTQFYIFIPTYSCLWWDNADRTGILEETFYAIEKAAKELSVYDNVTFYCFIDNNDISDNLNNYMDTMHFSPEINKWIVNEISISNSDYIISISNIDERMNQIRLFSENEIALCHSILDN